MKLSRFTGEIKGSVYSKLLDRLHHFEGEVYPFHVGDTWMEPPDGCWMEDLRSCDNPGLHRYAPPQGLPDLLAALSNRVEARTGVPTSPDQVGVTAGATGALTAIVGAIVEPSDEVMILAPTWPLVVGMVHAFHGKPVYVPFFGDVDAPSDISTILDAYRTDRTRALYLNTPHNPSGRVIPPDWQREIVRWAREHDLWLIADEVYEDYQYTGQHCYIRSLAPERTISCYSFSKAFGMAGNRIGYMVGPTNVVAQCRKLITHFYYGAAKAAQLCALRVLQGPGDPWVKQARGLYAELSEYAAAAVGVSPPAGGTFLFIDVADVLDERGLDGFLEDCVELGIFVAPGPSFGPYPSHIRACFTASDPSVTKRGFDKLGGLIRSKRGSTTV